MTLGEKIKAARKNAGLTQEQLAEKLMVSRPAVTKWETDKGIPDIENCKALSQLLDISLDALLKDGEDVCLSHTKEPVSLSGKGKKHKDKWMRERYPEARIMTLLPQKKLSKREKIVDNLLGFLTDAPFGIPDFLNSLKLLGTEFYLVEQEEKQYLVSVGNESMESHRLFQKVNTEKGNKFQIGETLYTNCGPLANG